MKQAQINLSQDNVIQAAEAGRQLLETPGAVNVPGPMSISGVTQILHALLTAIANKQVVVLQPQPSGEGKKEEEAKGGKDDEGAKAEKGKAEKGNGK